MLWFTMDKVLQDSEDKDSSIPPQDVIIIGDGLAGLSAAIYLGRSRRDTLLIHTNQSTAKWEKEAQNYLGFSEGIEGAVLLAQGMQ
jgi:thioredoxin reductase